MQIDEQGHNYLNLTKKKREAMKELMNDCNIIINQQTKEVEQLYETTKITYENVKISELT